MVAGASAAGAPGPGASALASPSLEVRAWDDEALLPPASPDRDSLAVYGYPPDDVADANRDELSVRYATRAPVVDGNLDDWRLVRWNDITGARSRLVGEVATDADLSARFALQWDARGLWFAVTLHDDAPSASDAPLAALERVTLSLASQSPLVQRYWLAGSRSLRVRADGVVDGWTEVRNRSRDSFAAAALGVQAAVRSQAGTGTRTIEMFAPWAVFYPLYPHTPAQPLCNVRIDDVEDLGAESIAWSTRRAGAATRAQWGRLEWGAAPAGVLPAAAVIASGAHAESVYEVLVIPGGGASDRAAREVTVALRGPGAGADAGADAGAGAGAGVGASADARLRASAPAEPYFLRVRDLPLARGWSVAERTLAVEIVSHAAPSPIEHTQNLMRVPDLATVRAARAAVDLAPAAQEARFPQPADVAVRLDRATAAMDAMGEWRERRYHTTGLVAHRMATWAEVEAELEEAELFAAAMRQDTAATTRLASRWPQRSASGVPLGTVVLRGYFSPIDASVQPYTLYVPVERADPAPLVVALHGIDEDERTVFARTNLAALAVRHRFVAVCPYGRGNTGYRLAGERDVLDVLDAVRQALPIDSRRLAVTGAGLGGTGTWMLALRHPNLFAAAAPVSAYGDLDQNELYARLGYQPPERDWFNAHNPARLARAGMATAFRIVHGDRDAAISPMHAHIMATRLKELGVTYELQTDPDGDHGIAFFDAQLAGICEFFARHTRAAGGGTPAPRAVARRGMPVCDVFAAGPFVVVYGTQGATAADDSIAASEIKMEWRRRFAGDARLVADRDLDAATAASHNLILIGTPASNRWLGTWAERLPVRYEATRAIVNGVPYGLAEHGVVWSGLHPQEPTQAIVVCSGMRGRILGGQRSILMLASDCAIAGPGLGDLRPERLNAAP